MEVDASESLSEAIPQTTPTDELLNEITEKSGESLEASCDIFEDEAVTAELEKKDEADKPAAVQEENDVAMDIPNETEKPVEAEKPAVPEKYVDPLEQTLQALEDSVDSVDTAEILTPTALQDPLKCETKQPEVQVKQPEVVKCEVFENPNVSKDPVLIKAAQEDIKKIDLHVCGGCHDVFLFVEEFHEHKAGKCKENFSLKNVCESEGKPQVWGFTLWKTKQLKKKKEGEVRPSSWSYYQTWCKLPDVQKDAWVAAGQTLQYTTRMGYAKLSEVGKRVKDSITIDDESDSDSKKDSNKSFKINSDVTLTQNNKNIDTNKAFRTTKESTRREFVVESIAAKRFNPRRKTWEYQIKWEHFDSTDNTWEPMSNLGGCKKLIEEFEERTKKLKEEAKLNGTYKGRGRPRLSQNSTPKGYATVPIQKTVATTPSFDTIVDTTPGGRPQRASKQKALNQVKSWCGNISDTDDGGVKRPFDDDDSDDSFEKKMKLEDYSDSDEERPKYPLKKVAKPLVTQTIGIMNNGGNKPIPQNVLIPDANGVVRINQKQLPSLSTGVYIMSKTAGIIKLDSTTSKVASSGGQTIVKVAPKIGQTQIKIVKKEGGANKIIQMSSPRTSTPAKSYKPVITKIKRCDSDKTITKVQVKQKEEIKTVPFDDDSDDGLPELEFPTDLPLPEPDSPPGEFVLDPTTGKIVGQDYPEPTEQTEQSADAAESSLENIVKLAAADITEEDLKTEPTAPDNEQHEVDPLLLEDKTEADDNDTKAAIVKMETSSTSDESILNKALTNSNILQKTAVSPPKPKIQQRILNHTIGQRHTPTITQVVRQSTPNLMRTKPQAPRPKFNIASSSPKTTMDHQGVRNVYSKNSPPVRNKIGQTTIYRNIGNTNKPASRLVSASGAANVNVYKAMPRKEVVQCPAKPKQVINMPSLIGDDEPPVVTQKAATTAATAKTTTASPTPTPAAETPAADAADLSSFTLTDTENPIFITGDDGTVYQVAGQNEQGQTILITQGSDGQQQCLLVTNDAAAEEAASAEEEDAAQLAAVQPEVATSVSDPLSVKTDADTPDQVVAQVIRAEPPSPGGTHKVVVMLPDGNLMVTQVSPEEYASLELE